MISTLDSKEYLHLVNGGPVPLKQFTAGVYEVGGKFVSYRKNKLTASLGVLRDTVDEALKDFEIALDEQTELSAKDFKLI